MRRLEIRLEIPSPAHGSSIRLEIFHLLCTRRSSSVAGLVKFIGSSEQKTGKPGFLIYYRSACYD